MADLYWDDNILIDDQRPIQGSVSLDADDSEVSLVEDYTSEEAIARKGVIRHTLKWALYGKQALGITTDAEVSLEMGTATAAPSAMIKGTLRASLGWSSDWGFVTNYEITGTIE